MTYVKQISETLASQARTVIEGMMKDAKAKGAHVPADENILIDIATHAAETSLKAIGNTADRAAHYGEGADLVALMLATKYMLTALEALNMFFMERALEAALRQDRK